MPDEQAPKDNVAVANGASPTLATPVAPLAIAMAVPTSPAPVARPPTIPEHWLNVASKISFVSPGEQMSVAVQGGWVRGRAPVGGLVVESREGGLIFVPQVQFEGGALVLGPVSELDVFDEEILPPDDIVCGIKDCRSRSGRVEFVGTICKSCWAFASGEPGGKNSQARANALAAVRRP